MTDFQNKILRQIVADMRPFEDAFFSRTALQRQCSAEKKYQNLGE